MPILEATNKRQIASCSLLLRVACVALFACGIRAFQVPKRTMRSRGAQVPVLNQRSKLWSNQAAVSVADPNDQSYSASDWLHNIKSLQRSSILREIRGPVLATIAWSTVVSLVYKLLLLKGYAEMAARMCLSGKPHSLLVSSLGLLLVFRTNSAYQRFAEGRQIWEKILSISRNTSRMATLYTTELGSDRLERVLRLLSAFPYLLQHHLEPQCISTEKECEKLKDNALFLQDNSVAKQPNGMWDIHGEWKNQCCVDRRSLPWCLLPPRALRKCADSTNRPLWVCDRLSEEMNNVEYTDNFTSRERLSFFSHIDKLSQCVGECERIHQTAVPLNYARHSLRSLTLWLFTLPFAMIGELGLLTPAVMGAISWLMLGVYQIGYAIEDPFQGSLRLKVLCDAIYRDVMTSGKGMLNRQTAFKITADELREWKSMAPLQPEFPEKSWS